MKNFRTPYFFRWIFHRRIWGFSVSDSKVYLTFDDGPTESLTPWIIDLLDEHNVKATFFCVGANVLKHPKLVQELNEKGHLVANHAMRHEKGSQLSVDDYLASVDEADQHIGSKLFRPPYGRVTMAQTRRLRKKYKVIMWTWLSYDYDASVPVEKILQKATSIRSGDILVLHDNLKTQDRLKEILPELIAIVKKKGLSFELISA